MTSLKQRIWKELDKNPLLTPKHICRILHIDYKKYASYVSNVKTKWKFATENERGSKPSIHAWRGWTILPKRDEEAKAQRIWVIALMRKAVNQGWLPTKAKNKWILWKEKRGRLQLFQTGRINVYVRKPATMGKAYQLMCNAFSYTGLITDLLELQEMLKGIRFKGAHYVFEVGQRLPQLTIDLFGKSNGVIIKVGDRTHPTSLEVIASYPDWAERNEKLFEQLMQTLGSLTKSLKPPKKNGEPKRLEYIG